jgi:hypothetical protein
MAGSKRRNRSALQQVRISCPAANVAEAAIGASGAIGSANAATQGRPHGEVV